MMKLLVIAILHMTFLSHAEILNETKKLISIQVNSLNRSSVIFDERFTDKEASVTYENLSNSQWDCFGLGSTLGKILDYYLKQTENSTNIENVLFYANSRCQTERITMQAGDSFDLKKINFDIRRKTVFIVHGFLSGGTEEWVMDMEKAFLTWGNVNTFIVDWNNGLNTWNYLKAAANTRSVGKQIVRFITQIIEHVRKNGGPDKSKWGPLHFVGHSLGAHISSYAAKQLRSLTGWRVHRISGLDPAQPCFGNNSMIRLDRSDANFVDVIHTNGRMLLKLGLGLPNPLGHVDFYPNGGNMQPGCPSLNSSLWDYLPLPIDTIRMTICSHGRAHDYYTESIMYAVQNECKFWAQKWNKSSYDFYQLLTKTCNCQDKRRTCVEMGINAENYRKSTGTYFTITGHSSPYCSVDSTAIQQAKDFTENYSLMLRYLNDLY